MCAPATGHRMPRGPAPPGRPPAPPPMPPPPPLVALLPTPQRCVVHVARWRRHHSSTDIRRETGYFCMTKSALSKETLNARACAMPCLT